MAGKVTAMSVKAMAAMVASTPDHGVDVTAFCPGPVRTQFADRANAKRSALFRAGHLPDGDEVGRAAWQACMQGRRLVVHGALNKLQVFAMRFTPRTLLAKIVRRVSRPV